MKPDKIFDILDLAYEIRQQGGIWNPMFEGHAGLGKSAIIRQWVDKKRETNPKFGFVDCRIAYYEGPDFVGYPKDYEEVVEVNGEKMTLERMKHCLPEMWPTEGEGLFLFEEPNRGNSMVMNCLMQILTDRQVGTKYFVPNGSEEEGHGGWMFAGAMNQEGADYDVNAMDTALKDRFEFFEIDFDYNGFLDFIETNNWNKNIVQFLKSAQWVYKTPDAIGQDGKYISPRTWSKLNAAEAVGLSASEQNKGLHRNVCMSILGKHVGNEYWRTCWDDAPVVAEDIMQNLDAALSKLKKQSDTGKTYAGDKVAITVESIIENYGGYYEGRLDKKGEPEPHVEGTLDEAAMVAVASIIPSDQAINLIQGCGFKSNRGKVTSFFKEFYLRNPECVEIMRGNIKIDRSVNKSKK